MTFGWKNLRLKIVGKFSRTSSGRSHFKFSLLHIPYCRALPDTGCLSCPMTFHSLTVLIAAVRLNIPLHPPRRTIAAPVQGDYSHYQTTRFDNAASKSGLW